jgi:hypothetical protein
MDQLHTFAYSLIEQRSIGVIYRAADAGRRGNTSGVQSRVCVFTEPGNSLLLDF